MPEFDAREYATQTDAPTPDYRQLMRVPSLEDGGWTRRNPTSAPPPDANKIGQLWLDRLESKGALMGAGMAGKGPESAVKSIDTGLTENEFKSWAKENGWTVPTHISWSFVTQVNLPPVSEAARKGIRVWPASKTRTGPQLEALFYGRVELRDGCFYASEGEGEPEKLAWFHAEMGLDIDEQGFYIFRDRITGWTLARLGEQMNWGGPASAVIDPEAERALRAACGDAQIYVVGSPQSHTRFNTQYPPAPAPPPPPSAD